MNIRNFLSHFVTAFAVTLFVSAIVTLLGNLVVHGASTIDWETSFRSATVFGIIFSLIITKKQCGLNCTGPER